ncbi:MAG: NUDIX domain-containing protein [Candidatus Heimdallarchaeota archaeon]
MSIIKDKEKNRCHSLGVGGFCFHEDKVLLVKHVSGAAQNQWCQPGGYVAVGESLTEAIEREILEETGVKTKATNLFMVRHYNRESKSRGLISDILLLYCVEYLSGKPKADLDEVEEAQFIPFSEIDDYPLTDLCKTIIEIFIKKPGLELLDYNPPEEVVEKLSLQNYQLYG